jgi:hypothetical protein
MHEGRSSSVFNSISTSIGSALVARAFPKIEIAAGDTMINEIEAHLGGQIICSILDRDERWALDHGSNMWSLHLRGCGGRRSRD